MSASLSASAPLPSCSCRRTRPTWTTPARPGRRCGTTSSSVCSAAGWGRGRALPSTQENIAADTPDTERRRQAGGRPGIRRVQQALGDGRPAGAESPKRWPPSQASVGCGKMIDVGRSHTRVLVGVAAGPAGQLGVDQVRPCGFGWAGPVSGSWKADLCRSSDQFAIVEADSNHAGRRLLSRRCLDVADLQR